MRLIEIFSLAVLHLRLDSPESGYMISIEFMRAPARRRRDKIIGHKNEMLPSLRGLQIGLSS